MGAATDKSIEKASKLGSLLNSWISIVLIAGTAVSSCTYAYYKIFDNEKEIILQEERSDKRYNRAMEMAIEMKNFAKYQEQRIIEIEKKVAFIEGQNSKIK